MNLLSLPSNLKGVYLHWKKLQQVHKLAAKREWFEVIALFDELTTGQENDFFGYYYKGVGNTELKLFDEALVNFDIALANLKKTRFPKIMEEYKQETELRIAYVFRLQRKYDQSRERLDQLIEKYPKYLPAYKSKAGIQIDQEQLRNALDTTNQGLKHFPTDQGFLNLRSSLVYELTTQREE